MEEKPEEEKAKKQEEPDYLDPNFLPRSREEQRKMMIARLRKEEEDEQKLHQLRLEAERLKAQAELELKRAEVLANLRKQQSARMEKEERKAQLKRASLQKENTEFFQDIRSMNDQLMERAEEFMDSLLEQERRGLIIIKRKADQNS